MDKSGTIRAASANILSLSGWLRFRVTFDSETQRFPCNQWNEYCSNQMRVLAGFEQVGMIAGEDKV
jgi:hypothetical protein